MSTEKSPWKVAKLTPVYHSAQHHIIIHQGDEIVARASGNTLEEAQLRAELIASAPALKQQAEALAKALETIMQNTANECRDDCWRTYSDQNALDWSHATARDALAAYRSTKGSTS